MGETGTGKDLAAHAVHEQSERKGGPYIAVNLGASPPELVRSELFDHEKGAFAGAL
jgi:sigma-54 specific flagellar transcriptional regulator A